MKFRNSKSILTYGHKRQIYKQICVFLNKEKKTSVAEANFYGCYFLAFFFNCTCSVKRLKLTNYNIKKRIKTKTKSCKRDSKQWGHLTAPSSLRFRCNSSRLVKSWEGLLHLILKGLAEVVLIDGARRRGGQQRAALASLRALKHKTFLGNRFREPLSGWTELLSPLRLTQWGERFSRTSSAQHAYIYLNHFEGLNRKLWRTVYYYFINNIINIHCRAVFTLVSILMVFPDLR